MEQYKKEPGNVGYQRTQGNPAQNPPHQQPQAQYPAEGQYAPPDDHHREHSSDDPDDPCYRPKPPGPKPPDPCKAIAPPEDPGCTPSDQDCTPVDPCAEYYESHDCSDCEGPCNCPERPCDWGPITGTIRQQLTAIEELVNNPPPGTPKDATDQLTRDLKALEDEYAGLAILVTDFETARTNTIDCEFGKTRKWLDKLQDLCENNLHCDITVQDIQEAYDHGKQKERDACCAYIRKQSKTYRSYNCADQATSRETDANSDFKLLKGLSDTLTTRLKDLETIFKNAVTAAENRQYKTVCAFNLEFHGLWVRLFTVETTCYLRKNCCVCCPKCDLLPDTLNCWTVDRYRSELQKALKALIAAKYNRYLWTVYTLKQKAEIEKLRADCENTAKNRQARFLAEAEEARDCPSPTHNGDCGCGKQHKGA